MSLTRDWSWVLGEILREKVFWVERGMEEAKQEFFKNYHCLALKTTNCLFHFMSKLLEKLSWNGQWETWQISWVALTSEASLKLSVWILENTEIGFLIFTGRFLVATYFEKVFQQKWNRLFGKNSKHTKYIKTLSKTYKILKKKKIKFDQQAIEYPHHIWTRTIT